MKKTRVKSRLEIWGTPSGKFSDTKGLEILQIEVGAVPGEYIVEVIRKEDLPVRREPRHEKPDSI